MLQTSTWGPYFFLPSNSGAAYAGLPHCVTRCSWARTPSFVVTTFILLLRPKSRRKENNFYLNHCYIVCNTSMHFSYVDSIAIILIFTFNYENRVISDETILIRLQKTYVLIYDVYGHFIWFSILILNTFNLSKTIGFRIPFAVWYMSTYLLIYIMHIFAVAGIIAWQFSLSNQ